MKKKENPMSLVDGVNDLQVLVFLIAGNYFGINVAQVKEMVRYQDIERAPYAQPSVEGVIRVRDEVHTVVDLAKYMDFPASEDPAHDMVIISDLKQTRVAFHVHKAKEVIPIPEETIEKPGSVMNGYREDIVTGIAKLDDRVITLIDCEKIILE